MQYQKNELLKYFFFSKITNLFILKYTIDPSFNWRGVEEIKAGSDVNILERVRQWDCT